MIIFDIHPFIHHHHTHHHYCRTKRLPPAWHLSQTSSLLSNIALGHTQCFIGDIVSRKLFFFFLCFRRNPHEVGYFHPITTIFYSICLSISQLSSPFFTTLISPVIFSFFSYHNHLFSFYWYELSYILMRYRSPFSSAQTSPRSNRILLEKYCQIYRQ